MERLTRKTAAGKPHRKPDRHRREPSFARMLLAFLGVALAFFLVLAAAEALCAALGCPADPYALR